LGVICKDELIILKPIAWNGGFGVGDDMMIFCGWLRVVEIDLEQLCGEELCGGEVVLRRRGLVMAVCACEKCL
jgi:hypothetical protein